MSTKRKGYLQRAGLGEEWILVFRQPTTEVDLKTKVKDKI